MMRVFIWIGEIGICFFGPSGFARFDENGSVYGPYFLWFNRKFWPVYTAVTKPYKPWGVYIL